MNHFAYAQEDELIKRLLGKLKEAGPEYPPRLFEARRAAVLASMRVPAITCLVGGSWFGRLTRPIRSMALIDKILTGARRLAHLNGTGSKRSGQIHPYISGPQRDGQPRHSYGDGE
jgi:hypothetical protein